VRGFHLAVIDTLMRAEGADAATEPVDFVLGQVSALAPFMRVGVEAAAVFLAAYTFVTTGRSFPSMTAERRATTVRRWETLGLPPARLYLRLIRSLTLFAAFDPSHS
jgi:hypothetical protein